MADPKRWLEDGGGATDAERALLRDARDVGPKSGDFEAVLAGVMARVGAPGGSSGSTGGSSSGGAAAGRASGSTFVKLFGAALVIGAAVWLFTRPRAHALGVTSSHAFVSAGSASVVAIVAPPVAVPASADPSSVAVVPPQTEGSTKPLANEHVATKSTTTSSVAPSTSASTTSTLASRLKEESELIAHARDALRSGDNAGALSYLDKARTKFPNGVLVQERRMLEIETLWRSGKKAQAAALADAFLASYPNSPNAARVREFQKP